MGGIRYMKDESACKWEKEKYMGIKVLVDGRDKVYAWGYMGDKDDVIQLMGDKDDANGSNKVYEENGSNKVCVVSCQINAPGTEAENKP